ncbi:MAG: hypothetical protein E7260_00365 [Lachnospiraceae bacterium]|nr:hypothetical protein [Lachnospiraceae bacterium]
MHRLLEETLEMLCYVIVLVGTLFLCSEGMKDRYHLNCAEQWVHAFLEEAERQQKITPEDLEVLEKRMMEAETGYSVSIQIKRKEEVFDMEQIRENFISGKTILLQQGDFILVCIRERERERSIRYAMIWW